MTGVHELQMNKNIQMRLEQNEEGTRQLETISMILYV